MSENETPKNYEESSEKALNELFEFFHTWAEKWEEEDLYFEGVLNIAAFSPDGDCVGGRYTCNITSKEMFDIMNAVIIKDIEERECDNE